MYRAGRWLFSLMMAFSFSVLAASEPLTVEQTLRQLYLPYTESRDPVPLDTQGENRIVSSRLAQALQTDNALTPQGDAGALDWDPRCGCQDYDHLVVERITLATVSENSATAFVRLRPYRSGEDVLTIQYKLVKEQNRWLIDDIIENNQSTYQLLSDSNQKWQNQLAALQRPEAAAFVREVFTNKDFDALSWQLLLSPAARKTVEDYYQLTFKLSAKEQENRRLPDIWETTPICGCVSPTGAMLNAVTTLNESPEKAQVRVRYQLPGEALASRDILLVRNGGQWQIDDFITPDEGSLMQRLRSASQP